MFGGRSAHKNPRIRLFVVLGPRGIIGAYPEEFQ